MAEPAEKLSATDLWPIARKLPRDEQVQLAKLLLREAASGRSTPARADAEAYAAIPPAADEFPPDDDALDWEAEGWEEFYAKG